MPGIIKYYTCKKCCFVTSRLVDQLPTICIEWKVSSFHKVTADQVGFASSEMPLLFKQSLKGTHNSNRFKTNALQNIACLTLLRLTSSNA